MNPPPASTLEPAPYWHRDSLLKRVAYWHHRAECLEGYMHLSESDMLGYIHALQELARVRADMRAYIQALQELARVRADLAELTRQPRSPMEPR